MASLPARGSRCILRPASSTPWQCRPALPTSTCVRRRRVVGSTVAAAPEDKSGLAAASTLDQSMTDQRPKGGPKADKSLKWRWEDSSDAQRAYLVLASVLVIGTVPWAQQFNASSLVYFISLAVCTIYIGAHKGLTTGMRQQLSVKEGLLAPFAASVSLFGLYLILTYLPDLSLQGFLDAYFFLLGSFAISGATASLFKVVPQLAQKSIVLEDLPAWLLIDDDGNAVTRSESAPADVIGLLFGIGLAGVEVWTHHSVFTLSNLVACLIATDILQLIGIRSFRTAGVLLVGLLLYDVFWVFGSPSFTADGESVMMTVATSEIINAPTRLLFPRIPGGISEAASFPYSLLGLGDIAVPGLLACLALRYDASRVIDMRPRALASFAAIDDALSSLPKDAGRREMGEAAADAASEAYDDIADADDARRNASTVGASPEEVEAVSRVPVTDAVLAQRRYFTPVMVAYVAGLLIAFAANAASGKGQPALLYLCPLTLFAVLLTALSRREVKRVWEFVDLPSSVPPMPGSKARDDGPEGKGPR